ncbi:MAG: VWA domain-containing protein [Nitrospiraceae bacterium]|nr:VWA domain-containing protein [Nitrospiraceae bacterium]
MQFNFFGLKVFINMGYRSWIILLILNVLVIITFFFMAKLREKRIIKFGNFATLKRVEGYKRFSLSPSLLIFKMIIITLLFMIANHSIQLNIVKPISNTDFMLLIDASPSMSTPDYSQSRLFAAKSMAIDWLSNVPSNAGVGVLSFSNDVNVVSNITTNYRVLKSKISGINLSLKGGGTSIFTALEVSSSFLKEDPKQRAVILITDGVSNGNQNISQVISLLKRYNVTVYTIGLGTNNKTINFYKLMNETLNKHKVNNEGNGGSINATVTSSYHIPVANFTKLEIISNSTGGKTFIIHKETSLKSSLMNILVKNQKYVLDSDYYLLIAIVILLIFDYVIYAKFGAI